VKKVLLINPPVWRDEIFARGSAATASLIPPLGLAHIASCLRQKGHFCEIYDGVATPLKLSDLCKKAQGFDVVAITVVSAYYLRVQQVIKAISKQCTPRPIIVVGGAHVTAKWDELLYEGADYAVIGEGELTAVELLNWIDSGQNRAFLDNIAGIAYLDEEGKVCRTAKRRLIENLDDLPMPARDLLPMNLYRGTPARTDSFPSHSLLTSRGCSGVCTFCSHKSFGKMVRSFSPDRIVEEFFELRDVYGANDVAVWDDNFTANKDNVYSVCNKLMLNKFDKSFSIESRVDSVDEGMLKILKKAGCNFIAYGFESGSQRILDYIHKRETLEQMRRTVELTKRVGIKIRGYFMFGFPTETIDEMQKTVDFARELKIDVASFTLMVPLPGTVEYTRAQKSGSFDPYFYKKSILPEFNFPSKPVYTPAGMEPDQLLRFHRKAYNSYYLRPSVIMDRILKIHSKNDFFVLAKSGITIIKNALGVK
jgi:radical SAM superfamily enzyme YgiQ (UPF0313 family)